MIARRQRRFRAIFHLIPAGVAFAVGRTSACTFKSVGHGTCGGLRIGSHLFNEGGGGAVVLRVLALVAVGCAHGAGELHVAFSFALPAGEASFAGSLALARGWVMGGERKAGCGHGLEFLKSGVWVG